ncbi:class I SAM-dependent methyltransferase [Paenibacillus agricola]|uniref:Class I SAM-dependent methyltransferase n=1 Tax=Paenibacillus agricola TaxID=2716264 RepID=A0ABX0IXE4_9BACL|nr:class I SAM-dependent methyltransferase [Paenibacillus agricola]NHN28604.1 class I SAM-dependent methyltransferase [Paenibacillus agricola]
MTIDFHDPGNSTTYTEREVDPNWKQLISQEAPLTGRRVVDIGCGGGIYSRAMVELGAAEVIGVDFSQAMLDGAAAYCEGFPHIRFQQGNAKLTGLESGHAAMVLERALIHHVSEAELSACLVEASRILQPGGVLVVQDRTPEDCSLAGSDSHLRGYMFEKFPKLLEKEVSRRHRAHVVRQHLIAAGFIQIKERKLWERRKAYTSFHEYRSDMLSRKGRSILHGLTDDELLLLVDFIKQQIAVGHTETSIIEQDRWTVWISYKP